ncbi:Uncharacterised protein [Mycobacteroides abscessus subsp. abscessus]|nr:Uncharacterised protein [Mycobacteroides abscessus subsp. abscessus]
MTRSTRLARHIQPWMNCSSAGFGTLCHSCLNSVYETSAKASTWQRGA